MDKLVSILIPVFNRVAYIEECIESALAQTYSNTEIIVNDNRSTDGTWEVIKKLAERHKKIKIFQNEENLGPVKNWRACISQANGYYAKILWSDDLMAEYFVETAVRKMSPKVGFVFSNVYLFYGDYTPRPFKMKVNGVVKSLLTREHICTEKYLIRMLDENIKGYPVSPGCALFRTSDLRKALKCELRDTEATNFLMTGAGNDVFTFLITALNYDRVCFVRPRLSYFRSHDESITVKDTKYIMNHYLYAKLQFIEQFYEDGDIYCEGLKRALAKNY